MGLIMRSDVLQILTHSSGRGPVYLVHNSPPSTQHVGLVPSKPQDSVRGNRFCEVAEGLPIGSVRALLKGHLEVA
jgi:hypothetical protein